MMELMGLYESGKIKPRVSGSHKLEVGYGSYGYEPNVSSFFGVPRSIETGGAGMNIRVGRTVETFTGEQELENQLRFQTGLISSALEHAVPEQMFSDPANPTDGVSAVKALQLAAQQGQRIYQIDQNNLNQALSDITLDQSVEDEIRNAVNQGRIAITHQSNIQVPGWTGAGYLILDPEVMDGSYKISGGGNGGKISVSEIADIVANAALVALIEIFIFLADKLVKSGFFALSSLFFGIANNLIKLSECGDVLLASIAAIYSTAILTLTFFFSAGIIAAGPIGIIGFLFIVSAVGLQTALMAKFVDNVANSQSCRAN